MTEALANLRLLLLIGFAAFGQQATFAGDLDSITAEYRDEKLINILNDLGEKSHTRIDIEGSSEMLNQRLSILVNQASFSEAIKRVLNGNSYLLIHSKDGGVVVSLINSERPGELAVTHNTENSSPSLGTPVAPTAPEGIADSELPSNLPSHIEVIPPNGKGSSGITLAEFDDINGQSGRVHPRELQVVPPESDNRPGVTLHELETLSGESLHRGTNEVEVVPPSSVGSQKISAADIEQLSQQQPLVNATSFNPIPPNK